MGQRSLGSGFQRRQRCLGGKNPKKPGFRGTRLFWKSLVCYTFGDRGWLKGVVRGRNKHFPSATEQAGSASSQTRSPGVCASRIRLFGCRWCREMERRSAGLPRNGAASPGEPKVYSKRSFLSTTAVLPNISNCSGAEASIWRPKKVSQFTLNAPLLSTCTENQFFLV